MLEDVTGGETIHCERHGNRRKAYVCDHLFHGEALGFYSSTPSSADPHPDAWCVSCEDIRLAHGGWNDESEALIKIRLVCGDCYELIRSLNTLESHEPTTYP